MKTTPEAHVVRDSIDPTTGVRLTTVQATMHRFVLAELNTHRAFCLSGESEVWAEAPNGTSRKYQLSYLYDKWHNGAAWAESLAPTANHQSMRDRLASIAIRQVSEEDLEPSLTRITDVIYSGEKETFTVKVGSRSIRTSIDHLFLTPDGWRRLGDLTAGSKVVVALRGNPELNRFVDYDFKSIDSIEAHGLEHTFDLSVEGDYPNFVANGFVVHNSRNSASSRAIPVKKQLARVQTDTAMPVEFGVNKPGMQASEALSGQELAAARYAWIKVKDAAVEESRRLSEELGVHKQVANRILEPWMWHTVIISSTEWNNFFSQRCSPLAQPEIRVVAELIREARESSTPMELHEGEWHTPYIQPDEETLDLEVRKKVSAARCARVSYLTQEGVRDLNEDLNLFERLAGANPPHHSPMEHVATPYPENFAVYTSERGDGSVDRVEVPVIGNFLKYLQLRHAFNNSRLSTER